MEADSDQRDNWERCNEASVGQALARQPNDRSGKNPVAIFLSLGSWGSLMGETCEESVPVVSLWCDSWEGTVTKLAGGLLFFLPFPLPCGGHYITLHYSTLPWGGLSLLYSTLLYLGAVFSLLYTTLHYWGHCSLLYTTLHYWGHCSLLYTTLHYWGHCSLLYTTYVRFLVAGGDLFVMPP